MKVAAGMGASSVIKNQLCTNETSEIIERLFAVESVLLFYPHGFCVVAAAAVSDRPVIAF